MVYRCTGFTARRPLAYVLQFSKTAILKTLHSIYINVRQDNKKRSCRQQPFLFWKEGKKKDFTVGIKNVGSVGEPETAIFLFGLIQYNGVHTSNSLQAIFLFGLIPNNGVHTSNSLQETRQNHWIIKYRSQ